jgi:hypothetical protein
MNYGGFNYLGVIAGMKQVGVINKAKINKVTSVKLLPFSVSPLSVLIYLVFRHKV